MSGERSIADIRETGAAWVTESELARVCDLAVRVEEPAGEPDEDLNREHTEHRIAEMSAPLPVPVGDETEALRAALNQLAEFIARTEPPDGRWGTETLVAAEEALARVAGLEAREASLRETHVVQLDVVDFHRALDIPVHDTPQIRRSGLRAALIEEEAKETVDAIRAGDLVEAIDGLCDLLCVVYGAAAEFGVNLAPFWTEVHRTNMAKAGGPVREDGKRLKPDGWTPPDIESILWGWDADSGEAGS